MRYAPPGLCVNDFALLRDADGTYAVLHLQGPWTAEFDHLRMETSFGRATSTDLVGWRPQGTTFGNGLPGRFDQQAVWTMHPFRHGDGAGGVTGGGTGGGTGMAMFYTGVSGFSPDGTPLQSVGLAYSDRTDGTGWRRHGTTPVVEADPRWYRTGDRMGWRDPFVVRDEEGGAGESDTLDDSGGSGGWVMVVCASDASLPAEVSGCVALATSPDLEHWTVHPPLISPGDIDELECPVLERLDDGSWLLLGSVGQTRLIESWTAPALRGPWTRRGPLAPTGAYAPRVIAAPDGARVVVHTTPRKVGLTDTGDRCRGMLAQPKSLVTPPDSPPRLEWWPGLNAHLGAETTVPTLHAVGDIDVTAPVDVTLRTTTPDGGVPALTVTCDGKNLRITGPDGARLEETVLPEPATTLRVLTVGEYVEVYADGVYALTTLYYSGHPTSWTATTKAGELPVPVRPIRLPDPTRDDASAIWPGPPRN